MYYSYDKVISYNAMLNFIIGERGVGKTYDLTRNLIKIFLKTGKEFVYLRRYKTELKKSVPKFFEAIIKNNEFPEHKLEVKNGNFYIDDKIAGYSIALSTANMLKSTTFANVYNIMFDEFIIDKGCYHYLHNEVENLLDIIETIGRMRNIHVYLLGNAISSTNPYFIYFNLTLPYNSNIKTFKNGLILINYIKNEEYRKVKKETRFGKLIEGTSYSKYAIDNEFLRDNKSFVEKRSPKSKFVFVLYSNGNKYGVWNDYDTGIMYISNKLDVKCPVKFTLSNDDHNNDTILLKIRTSPFLQGMIEHYRMGTLAFDNLKIKADIMPFIEKHLNY